MAKQDKIEVAQKTKAARTEKAALLSAPVVQATESAAAPTVQAGKRYWQIAGTQIYGSKKEELKDVRRSKNLEAGTPEFAYVGEGDQKARQATNANEWRYRITKGPDHPAA